MGGYHDETTATNTLRMSKRVWLHLAAGFVIGAMAGAAFALLASKAIAADAITGTAHVIDSDTLLVGEARIRLHGIDAPEALQTCMTARGGNWNCGADALGVLFDLVNGNSVTCAPRGRTDKYRRIIAVCVTGAREINAALVCRGMAWAYREYSTDYVAHEEHAKRRRIGVWQADSTPPWIYRKEAWDKALAEAPYGKPIVGIKRSGIYHTPWSPYYRKINLTDKRGKEFFADEAEAIAAGYAPPKIRPSFISRARKLFRVDQPGTAEQLPVCG